MHVYMTPMRKKPNEQNHNKGNQSRSEQQKPLPEQLHFASGLADVEGGAVILTQSSKCGHSMTVQFICPA